MTKYRILPFAFFTFYKTFQKQQSRGRSKRGTADAGSDLVQKVADLSESHIIFLS